MAEIVNQVSKQKLGHHAKELVLELSRNDEDGEELCRYNLREKFKSEDAVVAGSLNHLTTREAPKVVVEPQNCYSPLHWYSAS